MVKVRVLTTIKRGGTIYPAGSEITIPRSEYEARRQQERVDSWRFRMYQAVPGAQS